MRSLSNRQYKAFTLVEALVACVILGAAAVTLSAISTRCLSRTGLNQKYERAWQGLDRQLSAIEAMGIEEFLQQGVTEGELQRQSEQQAEGQDKSGDQLYWRVETASEEIDNLYKVRITVSWQVEGKEKKIVAETLMNGKGGQEI